MKQFGGEERRAPTFRPTLAGCVAKDLQMASALENACGECLARLARWVQFSLRVQAQERELSVLFDELAEETLAEFRLLGELVVSLGGAGRWRFVPPRCARGRVRESRRETLEEGVQLCRREIDRYQTLMARTDDRVVRSVLARLIADHERRVGRLLRVMNS